MAFQLHKVNASAFAKDPTLRDAKCTSYATLALACDAREALSGKLDSLNGDYWNAIIFDTVTPGAPVVNFVQSADD